MILNNKRSKVKGSSCESENCLWELGKIGDFVMIKHGFAFKGSQFTDTDTGSVVLTPGNFHIGGGFKSEKLKFTTQDCPEEYTLRGGQIIISMTDLSKEGDTLGYSALVPSDGKYKYLHNQRIGLALLKGQEILPEFIYWVMRTREFNRFLVGSATGSTVKHTSPSRIEDFLFRYPNRKSEQQAIAKILSDLDSKIELNQQMNNALESIAQAIFKHWFIDFEFPDENGKPYKSSGGEMVYNEELGKEIPKGWCSYILSDICIEITDGSHYSPKEDVLGTKHIATVKDMGSFDIDPQVCKRISDVDYDKLVRSGCRPEKGNILLSKDGTMGIVHLFNGQSDLVLLSSIAILRVGERIPSSYLFFYLKDQRTQTRLIVGHSSGSALPRIVLKDLKRLSVLVPTTLVLDKFAIIADLLAEAILNRSAGSRTLSNVRDILLPKLISGKIRVPQEA